MNSFFKNLRALLAAVVVMAGFGFATSASAQCVSGCLPETPAAPPMGLTIQGWTLSGAVGQAETNGTGQNVTGQTFTKTEELFKLSADTFLTGNANTACTVDCRDSQSRLGISGFSSVAAGSIGTSSFDGSSCATGSCPLGAASVSRTGTNAMFKSSLFQQWQGTAMPVTPPTN